MTEISDVRTYNKFRLTIFNVCIREEKVEKKYQSIVRTTKRSLKDFRKKEKYNEG